MTAVTGTFTGTGSSDSVTPIVGGNERSRIVNVSLSGTWTATVLVERSFNNGTTWHTVATHTANVEEQHTEQEPGVKYRLRASAYSADTVVYRISF